MRKNVKEVLGAFLNGERRGREGDSISTDGERIFSYDTILVERERKRVVVYHVNVTPYSKTTTTQQNSIIGVLENPEWAKILGLPGEKAKVVYHDEVPMGEEWLTPATVVI